MLRLLQADFYRLTRTKSIYIIIALFTLLFIYSALTETVGTIGVTNEAVSTAKQGIEWDFKIAMQFFILGACLLIYCFIIYYVHIFSMEFSNHTYKNIFMTGTSRSTFLMSKLTSLFLSIFMSTTVIFGAVAGVCLIYYGKPEQLPNDYLLSTFQFIAGLSLCIMVYYVVASFLQLLFHNVIPAIIFIVLAPIVVQVLQVLQDWQWLKYVDYLSLTQAFGLGSIKGEELLPYIYVNSGIVIVTTALSIMMLKRKEF